MYLYTKVKYQKIALISNCFTLIVEQFFRFDRVDIREESFLKKFACLGMPFFFFFFFSFFYFVYFFFFSFLNSWIQNYSALHKIKQNISARKAHFTIYGKLDIGLENVCWIVFFPYWPNQVTSSHKKLRNQTLLLSQHFRWTIPIYNG